MLGSVLRDYRAAVNWPSWSELFCRTASEIRP
jgi:hypothetical protein